MHVKESVYKNRHIAIVLITIAITIILSMVWAKGGRPVGHDGFYYIKYAKEFTNEWPLKLGSHWPYGYPLLGSFLANIGLNAYHSLILLSGLGFFLMVYLNVKMLLEAVKWDWKIFGIFAALGAAPVVSIYLITPMSDLVFSSIVTIVICSLYNWPEDWAVWLSGLASLLAFCIRYIGIFLFGVLILYIIFNYSDLKKREKAGTAITAILLCTLVAGSLMYLNWVATGYISGAPRSPGGGIIALPLHAAHMGWSIVGAFFSTKVPKVLFGGVETVGGQIIGLLIFLSLIGLLLWSLIKKVQRPFQRSLAVIILFYIVTMVIFRSVSHFANLSGSRFILPVLYPLVVLIYIVSDTQFRKLIGLASVILVVTGSILASRGISRELHGNIEFARKFISDSTSIEDTIAVNSNARRLSAYREAPFHWIINEHDLAEMGKSIDEYAFAVFLTSYKGRYGDRGYTKLRPLFKTFCERAAKNDKLKLLTSEERGCIVKFNDL